MNNGMRTKSPSPGTQSRCLRNQSFLTSSWTDFELLIIIRNKFDHWQEFGGDISFALDRRDCVAKRCDKLVRILQVPYRIMNIYFIVKWKILMQNCIEVHQVKVNSSTTNF